MNNPYAPYTEEEKVGIAFLCFVFPILTLAMAVTGGMLFETYAFVAGWAVFGPILLRHAWKKTRSPRWSD